MSESPLVLLADVGGERTERIESNFGQEFEFCVNGRLERMEAVVPDAAVERLNRAISN